jgi:hypothetical protein
MNYTHTQSYHFYPLKSNKVSWWMLGVIMFPLHGSHFMAVTILLFASNQSWNEKSTKQKELNESIIRI